jgi:NhaP-type Na+/H+ or K+/H+ antiporter
LGVATGILFLGLIYFLAHGFTAMFAKTRIPDVLFLIGVGLLLGPVLRLITPEDFGKIGPVMTTLALLVILLDSGTNLHIRTVLRSMGSAVILALTTFLVTMLLVAAYARQVFVLEWLPALMLGGAVGGTSTAIVIPLVNLLRVRDPAATLLVLESALTDVLVIVTVVGLVQAWHGGGLTPTAMLGTMLAMFILAAILGAGGALAWLAIQTLIRQYPNTLSTTLGFSLILYGVVELLGYSGPIAVLCFGIALANHEDLRFNRIPFFQGKALEITAQERAFHGELVFIFKTFFFVYLGISIPLARDVAVAALVATVLIYVARLGLTRMLLTRKARWEDAAIASFMVPKGLAAAVIAGYPLREGVPGGETIRDATFLIVLLSVLFTVLLVPLSRTRPVARWYRLTFRPFADGPPVDPEESVPTAQSA